MKIKADNEGFKALEQLVDIALKQGGISNLKAVNQFLNSVEPLVELEMEEEK